MHKWSNQTRFDILELSVIAALAFGTLSIVGGISISFVTLPATISSPFTYYFSVAGTLGETGSMAYTTSPYWWLNSGGQMILVDGVGQTMQNDASLSNRWRTIYAYTNPIDTDNGLHPQNIFRMLSRSTWGDARVEANFFINKSNFSSSSNRNTSNGLLLMSRYQDDNTLYYAGIRVDGTAVIKKKYKGTYYTMAQKKIFPGVYGETSENLLPEGEWIGIRSESVTNEGSTITIRLSIKREGGTWTELLKITDTGKNFGWTPPISKKGYVGIRTDFMDVSFDTVRIESL